MKKYTKKQIQKAIRYWTRIMESMDNNQNDTVFTPETLDNIYGKSIYDTSVVEFAALIRKGYFAGKPEDCYPDEYEEKDIPVKDLEKKDMFYKRLIANLGEVDLDDEDEPSKSEIEQALEMTLDDIREKTEKQWKKEAEWDRAEQRRRDMIDRDEFLANDRYDRY